MINMLSVPLSVVFRTLYL